MPEERIGGWLTALADIGAMVNKGAPLPELLTAIARTACELMGFDFCAVTLPDDERRFLRFQGSFGLSDEYIHGVNSTSPILISNAHDSAPSSQAFISGKPLQIIDTMTSPAFSSWSGVARVQGFKSMAAVPLIAAGQVLGTLNSYTRARHDFEPDLPLLAMLADQAALSITAAQLRAQQAEAIRDLNSMNTSLEQQFELQRQAGKIHDQLTTISFEGGGITAVAEALADLLGRPATIVAADGDLLHSTSEDADFIADPALVRELTPAATYALGPSFASSVELQGRDGTSRRLVRAPVILQEETVAWILVEGEVESLQPLDLRAIEHTSTVLALEVLRARTVAERRWRRSDEILTALLNGDVYDSKALIERARLLGHAIEQVPHAALVFRRDRSRDDLSQYQLASAFHEVSRDHAHKPILGIHQGYLIVLWPDPSGTDTDWAAIVDTVRRACGIPSGREEVLIGVSRPVQALQEYQRAYRIGRGAVELAALHGRREATVFLGEADLAHILLQFDDSTELHRFVQSILAPLHSYDQRAGSDLFSTLVALIANDMNAGSAAAELFIHKNTVIQRRRRIESLLGRNLASVRELAEVILAVDVEEALSVGEI